jgi:hypothetical protein
MKTEAKFDLSLAGELNLDLILYGIPTTFELDREHLASGLCLTLVARRQSSLTISHFWAIASRSIR